MNMYEDTIFGKLLAVNKSCWGKLSITIAD